MTRIPYRRIHRSITVLPLYFLFFMQNVSGQIHPVASESSIHFTIHNFGFKTGGSLAAPAGDILFNPDDLAELFFSGKYKNRKYQYR